MTSPVSDGLEKGREFNNKSWVERATPGGAPEPVHRRGRQSLWRVCGANGSFASFSFLAGRRWVGAPGSLLEYFKCGIVRRNFVKGRRGGRKTKPLHAADDCTAGTHKNLFELNVRGNFIQLMWRCNWERLCLLHLNLAIVICQNLLFKQNVYSQNIRFNTVKICHAIYCSRLYQTRWPKT